MLHNLSSGRGGFCHEFVPSEIQYMGSSFWRESGQDLQASAPTGPSCMLYKSVAVTDYSFSELTAYLLIFFSMFLLLLALLFFFSSFINWNIQVSVKSFFTNIHYRYFFFLCLSPQLSAILQVTFEESVAQREIVVRKVWYDPQYSVNTCSQTMSHFTKWKENPKLSFPFNPDTV